MKTETIQQAHRQKLACIYLRQSTLKQVRQHQESTQRQYALKDKALQLGWPPERILILDRDLGISGTQMANRPDFQRLVSEVSLQKVGGVFALEASRLSRSDLDWHRLVDLCSWTGTLLIDEDGTYNPGDFNDRLLLGLKGTMSQAELHFLRARLQGGKLNKARKGQLRFPLPVGLVYAEPEGIVLDPDQEVQEAVRLVFASFAQMASAYGVVQHFAEHQLLFPKRSYGGVWNGQLRWGRLNHGRVLGLLRNPAYAGAYVFGRYRTCKTFSPTGQMHNTVRPMPLADWQVNLPNQHPGYISWEEYLANQQRLAQNQTNGCPETSGSAAREGPALLQGLLICGQCGRRLSPRYLGEDGSLVWYECNWRRRQLAGKSCWSVRGDLLDEAVAQRIVSALVPAQIEIALAALEEVEQRDRALDHQFSQRPAAAVASGDYDPQGPQAHFAAAAQGHHPGKAPGNASSDPAFALARRRHRRPRGRAAAQGGRALALSRGAREQSAPTGAEPDRSTDCFVAEPGRPSQRQRPSFHRQHDWLDSWQVPHSSARASTTRRVDRAATEPEICRQPTCSLLLAQ